MTPELSAGSSAEFLLLDFFSVVIIHPERLVVDLRRARPGGVSLFSHTSLSAMLASFPGVSFVIFPEFFKPYGKLSKETEKLSLTVREHNFPGLPGRAWKCHPGICRNILPVIFFFTPLNLCVNQYRERKRASCIFLNHSTSSLLFFLQIVLISLTFLLSVTYYSVFP